MSNRHMIRLLGIPATYTKQQLEQDLKENNIEHDKNFFATTDGVCSTGFAFVEFFTQEQKEMFGKIYGLNQHRDAMYCTLRGICN